MPNSAWKKYVLAFVITAAIFVTALYISNQISAARVNEIAATQDKISLDIAASETQFALLGERSCESVGESTLSDEMGSLAAKLSYTEGRLGSDNPEVLQQKKYYSLLEVKDFLLSKKMTEKCGWKPVTILYFYSNDGDCPDCANEGYVLTHLRQLYPQVRVYSFDYNLDFSIIDTMRTMYHIKGPLPALVINDAKATYGFQDEDTLINSSPQLKALAKAAAAAAKNATTTPTR
ncbi:MAG: hypothetical protein A2675_01465 [Candidatus Yonathbacteria bacterium RIFCSPHIGHO2_01_FULL_51_10]|uniref:Thioredoxin domain-containing protein n=1 Tax=Candidatus Yonathbacteria bacterium RIFCSPHIGHO2_01_FULL_51_10 TaxID=1802723 RepID=A0A1G2S456_9BACT|nr:MAG: hypothetical protein A2675_01465 [Candidatus Yonathbacteria bacterium RIFCSPHIGHO2_01_FULL_51_10]